MFLQMRITQVPSSVVLSYPRTRRIVIESTSESADDYEPYIPTILPGVDIGVFRMAVVIRRI